MQMSQRKLSTLTLNTQFGRIYKKGTSCAEPTLVMYLKQNGLSSNRLGITVSKKIGKAVVRNRAKRRLREVFRLNSQNLKNGYDFILVSRGRTPFSPFSAIERDFYSAAKKLGVLNVD